MKKLLWSDAFHAFRSADGQWTHNVAEAQEFSNLNSLIDAKAVLGMEDLEAYYSFARDWRTPLDFKIPLSTAQRTAGPP